MRTTPDTIVTWCVLVILILLGAALCVLAQEAIEKLLATEAQERDDALEARLTGEGAMLRAAISTLPPHRLVTSEHVLGVAPMPETQHPATWHGDGVHTTANRRGERERTAPAEYAAPSDRGRGWQLAGRMQRRELIEVFCLRCGRDLLALSPDPLRTQCPCTTQPAKRTLRRLP